MDHLDRSNLLTQLIEATSYFNEKSSEYDQLIKLEVTVEKGSKEFEKITNPTLKEIVLFSLTVIFITSALYTFYFYLYIARQYDPGIILFILVDIPLILVFYFIIRSSKKRKLDKYIKKMDKLNNEKSRLLSDLYQNYQNFRYPGLLPFKYTFPGFIEIIYEYINDHRANTITDAINLYHDEIHKQNIEKSQKEIIKIANANNSSTRRAGNWAAAATAISVLGLFVKR